MEERSEETELRVALVDAGLVIETGVPGVHGWSEEFERIVHAVDSLVAAESLRDGAEIVRFPPVLSRHDLERSGYLASFPHLIGAVFAFDGTESEGLEIGERAAGHGPWGSLLEQTDVTLTPAACYPVYPWLARQGPLDAGGRLVDVGGWCFRREPSLDPARMQSFRMHENVRVGEPDVVAAWHEAWVERGAALLASLGLDVDVVPANDPFFGRGGKLLAKGQRAQGLKLEVVAPISSSRPGAILSANAHREHFGADFGIGTADGGTAHTACVGFGLERISLALLRRHGLSPASWPDEVRAVLWPDRGAAS